LASDVVGVVWDYNNTNVTYFTIQNFTMLFATKEEGFDFSFAINGEMGLSNNRQYNNPFD